MRLLVPKTSLLRAQDGFALPIVIGLAMVLTVVGISVIGFTSSNTRSSEISKDRQSAGTLAEAGVNIALAVLNKRNPDDSYTHNLLDANLLPTTTSSLSGQPGSVTWSGVLDTSGTWPEWTITSHAAVPNPSGAGADDLRREATGTVRVLTSGGSIPQLEPWDYVFTTATGNPCDVAIQNSTVWSSPLYVSGNLCLENSAAITGGSIVVHGNVVQKQSSNTIGSSVTPIDAAQIGGSCQWAANAAHSPCLNNAGASGYDQIFVNGLAAGVAIPNSPPLLTPPAIDFNSWYSSATLGPAFPCTSSSGASPNGTGSWTTAFDIDTVKNRNNPMFNLAPAWSYSCTSGAGALAWNATTYTLTISGAVYIDGDIEVNPSSTQPLDYDGVGAIMVSGTVSIKNAPQLCAARIDTTSCNWGTSPPVWDTSTDMLLFAAEGITGPSPMKPDVSVFLRSTMFQGALYGVGKIEFDTTTQTQTPMVGEPVLTGNSVVTHPFHSPMLIPSGAPITAPTTLVLGSPRVILE